MISFRDILPNLIIFVSWLLSTFICILIGYPILLIPIFIFIFFFHIRHKTKYKVLPLVNDQFLKMGYTIVSERMVKIKELTIKLTFEPTVGNVPISRLKYFRGFNRIFLGKNSNGKNVKINAVVSQRWNGNYEIKILKESILDDFQFSKN